MQTLCLKSAEGVTNNLTVIVTVFKAAGLTVSEIKTETMPQRAFEPGIPDLTARHRRSGMEV